MASTIMCFRQETSHRKTAKFSALRLKSHLWFLVLILRLRILGRLSVKERRPLVQYLHRYLCDDPLHRLGRLFRISLHDHYQVLLVH